MRARNVLVAALSLTAAAFAGAACSDDSASSGSTSTSTSGTGGSTFATDASTGALGTACTPACVAPQFCSVASQCIDAGTCLANGDCAMGTVCDATTNKCVPGGGCGQQEANTTPIPPNLLIVLDRSCSMTQNIQGQTKWQIAVAALNQLMVTYANQIRFGLTLFPDLVAPSCAQDVIPIPPNAANEAAITKLLTDSLMTADPYFPNGPCVTNIDTAMDQASKEAAFLDTTRASYALLLTDGKQSACNVAGGDNGTLQIITDMNAAGVSTFVIGFGTGADPAMLSDFADAGGVPHPTTHYYDAADAMSLAAALDTIANATIGCDFELDTVPPDPGEIYVFFNNTALGGDATNGWTYDAATNTVTFHGTSCDQLKAGTVTDVDVVFGCDSPTPD